ncbi:MAG: glycosyltransferase family 4 protein [Anaerolineales bacterium]|jgi:glycosyltransferase involved in cell wall biosynthesis
MKYSVVFYCPDQHLKYNLHTLDESGVGGGVTSRVRMAHGLAALGHDVTLHINCPKDESIEGVKYRHFSQLDNSKTDIFIATTSGSGLNLSVLCDTEISAELRILMVHGVEPPTGIDYVPFDYVYSLSNFVRQIIINEWGIDSQKVFVTHRGVVEDYFQPNDNPRIKRDPYAIVYASHPSKGLREAIGVLHQLRKRDSRFSLHIYGGYQLWGEDERAIPEDDGIYYHGIIGQRDLAQQTQSCGFCLNLQSREEPFGMVVIEAMKAGCIVLVTPVGAFPEIITHGYNAFIIEENTTNQNTIQKTCSLILELLDQPDYLESIRQNAIQTPLDWKTVAKTWEGHWDWVLSKGLSNNPEIVNICTLCGGKSILLADGYHCTFCGRYQKSLPG